MMAKITKGYDFGGAVRYVTQEKKDAKLLDAKGVLTTDKNSIINSFRLQAQLRPDVKNMVGHISLDFSKEDVDKVDDNLMCKVADDYMRRMHIQNTQYILVRHFDREHPHCHLVFNRIDNDGHLISDKNDRIRSAKICKELTQKFGLHMAKGKDHVHRERLRGADAVKYQIYDALVDAVPRCKNWKELEEALKKQGISMEFIRRGSTSDIQGITFEKNGLHFNGSKVDRKFSFSKISTELTRNAQTANHRLHTNGDHTDSNGYESVYSNRQQKQSSGIGTRQQQASGSNSSLGQTAHIVSEVASATLGVANTAASAVTSIAAGVVAGAVSAMTAPIASSDGISSSAGGSYTEDLGDDYYIDEYGIRRKKRRGLRR